MRALAPWTLLALAACGPKLDPLLPLKAELAAARRAPVGDIPHARVAVAPSTATALARRALDSGEPITVPVMFATAAQITPTLGEPSLALSRSPACDCPRVELSVRGAVDVELSGLIGNARLADDLGFSATARGAARLGLDRGPDGGQVLTLAPVPTEPWQIEVRLDEQAGLIDDRMVARQVVAPLTRMLAQPVPLLTLPPGVPVRARRVELLPGDELLGALWLEAAPAEPPPAVSVTEGWALATNTANLLSGLRATFAELPQTRAWRVEPTGLALDGEQLALDLRLHKVARRPKWRSYRVEAMATLADGRLQFRPHTVTPTGKRGFRFSLVSPFVTGRVRKQVMAMELDTPAALTRKVGRSEITFTVERVHTDGDAVWVHGSAR